MALPLVVVSQTLTLRLHSCPHLTSVPSHGRLQPPTVSFSMGCELTIGRYEGQHARLINVDNLFMTVARDGEGGADCAFFCEIVDNAVPHLTGGCHLVGVAEDVHSILGTRDGDIRAVFRLWPEFRVLLSKLTRRKPIVRRCLGLISSWEPALRTSERMTIFASSPWKLSTVRRKI